MRYLNTAYVRSHRARIGLRKGCILISSPEGRRKIPLEALESVVMLGGGQITSQAMDLCVKRGVRVVALRKSGAIRFVVGGPTGGNVHLRMALYEAVADVGKSLVLAKAIVAAKLQNSRHVVARWARDAGDGSQARELSDRAFHIRERVSRLASAPTSDHVRGIEGDAARIYFRAMRQVLSSNDLPFTARNRRPPRDPVNALLSFCYSLLVTELIGAADSVGLDSQMGFFHRPRSGRPSLALDLAEEMRAFTDRFVVSLIRRRQVSSTCFERVPGGAVYLTDKGRASLLSFGEKHKEVEIDHTILQRRVGRWALPNIQATLLARHLRGDLEVYPPFVMA